MACDSFRKQNQTPEQRKVAIREALKLLEQKLTNGRVSVAISPTGAVAFVGWTSQDRDSVSDACAYRTLQSQGSWALKQAVARAEAMSGRKVSAGAVAGGVHSHDGGKTWHPGH